MIADLKPYPAMKDSGMPWLGEVPEQWAVRRLKQVCSRSALYGANVAATAYTATGIRFLRTTDITEDGQLKRGGVFLPHETVLEYSLSDGDLLISRSGTVGRSFLYQSRLHGPCAYAGYLVRFVPSTQVLPAYLFLFTKTQSFVGFLRVMAISSTIDNVNGEKYANAQLPLPSLPEQAAIVRFLDHADRRIRRYIRSKQKLIKLLEEQKQAIIHRAVTRGLDPNVRLKPSGVEWLGDVPEHWEVSRVKVEFHCLNRRRVPLSGTERGAMTLRRFDYYGASGVIDKVDDYLFNDELILIAEDGANLVLRNLPLAIIARGKFWVNNHAHILKPKRGNLEYLAAVMEKLNYMPWISGAAQPKLTQDRLMSIAIAVPPRQEQDTIIGSVGAETSPLRVAIERARSEISLLREYRARLISDVVTGKLDVREAAARLPDDAEERAPLDEADAMADAEEATFGELDAASEEVEA